MSTHTRTAKETALCELRAAFVQNSPDFPNAYLRALNAGASQDELEDASS